jgi:hypothetical protein
LQLRFSERLYAQGNSQTSWSLVIDHWLDLP